MDGWVDDALFSYTACESYINKQAKEKCQPHCLTVMEWIKQT
jgi:hypothetical protein